ncbi:Fic family protein [Aeromicrobium piscarium]|uniref:Fic family protein n=1 Tax=Aeromicrobium piscarium TaxID=2590901 RepID=A0A554RX97_9ACTN|nr:Fic family protein [Aeromicrobium piscarium]TSD58729.1 Fic family protein [Aeromicrobium piscarium]
MKTPAHPPRLNELLADIDARRLVEVLTPSANVMSQPYLPWDKLRFKTPPDDLTHEEWWLRIRWARRNAQRSIDTLIDKSGAPFSYTLPDTLLALNDEITRGASGHITISEQVTSPAMRDRYVVSSLIEESITSSQLEGASTSRQVAKDMLRTGRKPQDRSEKMIVNNYLAMRRIVELREEELTPELVCELHRIVTEGTLDSDEEAGVVQGDDDDRVAVWGDGEQLLHRPPPVAELPQRLERLCAFANGGASGDYMPPVLRALTVHFMMGFDHYFADGNGRTARALFYWSMLREGFWLAEFLVVSKLLKQAPSQYVRSFLLTEDDDGDLTHFFLYHLGIIKRAIDELHAHLARKADELREVQQRIRATPGEFNHRQLALLENAVKDPDAVYTAVSHSSSHNVTQQSARNDLADLERRDLVVRVRLGRQHAWRPAPDVAERLSIG